MDRKQFDQIINHCRQKFLLIANNLATIRSLAAKVPLTISKDSPLAANFILSANNAFQGGSDQPFEPWRVRYTTRRQKSKVDSDRQQFDPWGQIGNSPIFEESLAAAKVAGGRQQFDPWRVKCIHTYRQRFDPWRQIFILITKNSIIIWSPTIRSYDLQKFNLIANRPTIQSLALESLDAKLHF